MEIQNYSVMPGQDQIAAMVRYAVVDPLNGTQTVNAQVYLARGVDIASGPIQDSDVVAAVQMKINAAGKVAPVTVTMVPTPAPAPKPMAPAVLQPLAAAQA